MSIHPYDRPQDQPPCMGCGKKALDIGAINPTGDTIWVFEEDTVQTTTIAMHIAKADGSCTRRSFDLCPSCWPRLRRFFLEEFGANEETKEG